MKTDYYTLLGVAKDASADEIRKAYRKMAMQYHPDRNQGSKAAEEKFKQISEAYAVLTDPAKRKTYDTVGSADAFAQNHSTEDILKDLNMEDLLSMFGMKNSGWGNFKAGGQASGGGAGFSSVIEELFGRSARGSAHVGTGTQPPRGRPQPPQTKGHDAEVPIMISFEEAMRGVERHLRLNIDNEERELKVRIPAGVATGKRLKFRGKGHKGAAGNGDLTLVATVQDDPRFERKDDDLHTVALVRPSVLLLGGSVEVDTLEGKKSIKIAAGTSSAALVRIRNHGAPTLGKEGERGDLYVKLEVHVAAPLSEAQQQAATAMRDAGL